MLTNCEKRPQKAVNPCVSGAALGSDARRRSRGIAKLERAGSGA
jgi:hypothetical protein